MGWNNRVVRHTRKDYADNDQVYFGCHEVYYNDNGKETSMTSDSVIGYFDSVEDMIASLELILKDIKSRPIFEEPESWKGNILD